MDENWTRLIELETLDYIVPKCKIKRKGTKTKDKAQEVISSFRQGHTYLLSAQASDHAIKPLLQYYAINSFIRGLVLLFSDKRETALASAHGLQLTNIREKISNGNLLDTEIKLTDGILYEFLETVNNSSIVLCKTIKSTIPTLGSTIKLKELIQSFYRFNIFYERCTGEKPLYREAEILPHTGNSLEVLINVMDKKERGEEYKDIANMFFGGDGTLAGGENGISNSRTSNIKYQYLPKSEKVLFGLGKVEKVAFTKCQRVCLVQPFENCAAINTLGRYYTLAYFLGMYARYYPTSWMNIFRGAGGDKLYPLIYQILSEIEYEFPYAICEFVEYYKP